MSKKKGLSLEEKRTRMLEIFYESKDFFLLKELEKIAPKQKGIISQSVKDVVQSLVDDNLVDTDKIGTSVYFWSFPSKAMGSRQAKLAGLKEKLDSAKAKIEELDSDLKEAKAGKGDTDDRTAILEELAALEATREELKNKIKRYEGCDPEVLDQLAKEVKIAKEATNRWTDNIFAIQSWIGKKFPAVSVDDLNKQFDIPEELDYVE